MKTINETVSLRNGKSKRDCVKDNLMELNSTQNKILSIIGHDLRSIFNGIIGISDLLVEKSLISDCDDINKLSSHINDAAKRGYALLDNLLHWANNQTGHLEFSPRKISIKKSVEDVVKLHKLSIFDKKLEINICIAPDMEVVADSFMFETIIRNLISNSIKFNRTGGSITIEAIQHRDLTQVSIKDTGIGIAKENIPSLLSPNKKNNTNGHYFNNHQGTGLGLMLCKEFIRLHNGNIWVESEVGKGSKFWFTIKNKSKKTKQCNNGKPINNAYKRVEFFDL